MNTDHLLEAQRAFRYAENSSDQRHIEQWLKAGTLAALIAIAESLAQIAKAVDHLDQYRGEV